MAQGVALAVVQDVGRVDVVLRGEVAQRLTSDRLLASKIQSPPEETADHERKSRLPA